MGMKHYFILAFSACFFLQTQAQDSTKNSKEEEDFSQYGDVEYVGSETKTYANAKIIGLAPQRFASISWDAQGAHTLKFSDIGSYAPESNWTASEEGKVNYLGGLRLFANIPVISSNKLLWQLGFNYAASNYQITGISPSSNIISVLDEKGLKTTGLFSTLYKPLNDKQFVLVQVQSDVSGNYSLSNPQSLRYSRYSAAALWGKRPHDRFQWGVGLSQTYRAGALNYIPVILYNKTSKSGKWGTEILFPARAHARYRFSTNSLLLVGYELEGNSYRLEDFSNTSNSFELRRSELRPRLEFQKKLTGFFWVSAQAGVRLNYSFDGDNLPNGRDFFRGFIGQQPFAAFSSMTPAPYLNLGIHFVSP